MISAAFHTVIYQPLYNGLVFLIDVAPNHDVGIAVILLTLFVKFVLFPLSRQAVRTQEEMKKVAPLIEELKKTHKNDREGEARAMLALYREHNIRPFASFFLILLQLPILFGLYWVFYRGGLPVVDVSALYSFIPQPSLVDMNFIGFFDMAGKSIILAFLAGATQFIYARISVAPAPATGERSFQADLARSFNLQIRYVLPVVVTVIAYTISSAVALYWVTSNLFMIVQETIVRRKYKNNKNDVTGGDAVASVAVSAPALPL